MGKTTMHPIFHHIYFITYQIREILLRTMGKTTIEIGSIQCSPADSNHQNWGRVILRFCKYFTMFFLGKDEKQN